MALADLLAGCGGKPSPKKPPIQVDYVALTAQSTPLDIELPGRTTAYETADALPQVTGLFKARRFREGAIVRAGQTLYEIDRPRRRLDPP